MCLKPLCMMLPFTQWLDPLFVSHLAFKFTLRCTIYFQCLGNNDRIGVAMDNPSPGIWAKACCQCGLWCVPQPISTRFSVSDRMLGWGVVSCTSLTLFPSSQWCWARSSLLHISPLTSVVQWAFIAFPLLQQTSLSKIYTDDLRRGRHFQMSRHESIHYI